MANKTDQNSSSKRDLPTNLSKTLFWLSAALIFIAILDHLYLMLEHYSLRFGQGGAQSLCNINELFNCAAVSASRYSEFLGVPMALWGIAGNTVLFLLVLWHPLVETEKKAASRLNILLVAGLIAATSVVMGFISSFIIARLCPFCIVAYLLSFLTFGFLWKALGSPSTSPLAAKSDRNFTPLAVLATIAFVVSFIANEQIAASYGARDLGPMITSWVSGWKASPQINIKPVEPLVMGASADKAKMTIVEFADYLCPHCRHAAPALKAFTEGHSDVRLEFSPWPLDGECNAGIPQRGNGSRCLLTRAVYCASTLSSRGWHAQEWVFENQDRLFNLDAARSSLAEIANLVQIPLDRLTVCTDSAETKSAIEKQASVGTALNLQGTPAIFVNGRKLDGGQLLPVLATVYAEISSAAIKK